MTDTKKKGRKRKYIAGLAQLNFKIEHDWTDVEAKHMFESAKHPVDMDTIRYQDCIEGMQAMPEESVDLVIADPPFGIEFSGKGSQYNRDSELVEEGYIEVLGDEEYREFSERWIACLPRIMKPTATAYVVSGWTNLNALLNAIAKTDLILVNHIIWKYQFGVFTRNKFVSSHYHILFLAKDESKYFFNKFEFYPEDVWDIPRKYMPGQRKNGTKLPEDLVSRSINFSSKPGDLVFDPFMGNATTAVCAKGLYRHFYGFELNESIKEIHEENLQNVRVGDLYKPLQEYLPSIEELLEKYPHLKNHVEGNDS